MRRFRWVQLLLGAVTLVWWTGCVQVVEPTDDEPSSPPPIQQNEVMPDTTA